MTSFLPVTLRLFRCSSFTPSTPAHDSQLPDTTTSLHLCFYRGSPPLSALKPLQPTGPFQASPREETSPKGSGPGPAGTWEVPTAPVQAAEDCRDRDLQKLQAGRETEAQSQTEAKSERHREQVRCGGRELTGQCLSQAHMEIPVASDGRVGLALMASWCHGMLAPSMGSRAWRTCPPPPYFLSAGERNWGWVGNECPVQMEPLKLAKTASKSRGASGGGGRAKQ